MSEPAQINYVVTLVHGTWARDSEWYQTNSQFCKDLAASLPGAIFHPFSWTGKNSPTARHVAAKTLAHDLTNLVAAYPRAKHFVIAHSHGGNVALYALRDITLQPLIAGVVCLSTPFLFAQPRGLGEEGREFASGFRNSTWTILMLLFVGGLAPRSWPSNVIFLILLPMLVASLWDFLDTPPLNKIKEKLSQWLLARVGTMEMPARVDTPLLVVRTAGDEASSLLALSQFLSWLLFKFWQLLLMPRVMYLNWARKRNTLQFLMLVFLYFCVISSLLFFKAPTYYVFIVLAWPAVLFYTTLLAMMVIVSAVVSMSFIPFGLELAICHAFLEVTIESAPPGSHTVLQRPLQDTLRKRVGEWLNHSLPYQDPFMISVISDWMQGRYKGPAVPS